MSRNMGISWWVAIVTLLVLIVVSSVLMVSRQTEARVSDANGKLDETLMDLEVIRDRLDSLPADVNENLADSQESNADLAERLDAMASALDTVVSNIRSSRSVERGDSPGAGSEGTGSAGLYPVYREA